MSLKRTNETRKVCFSLAKQKPKPKSKRKCELFKFEINWKNTLKQINKKKYKNNNTKSLEKLKRKRNKYITMTTEDKYFIFLVRVNAGTKWFGPLLCSSIKDTFTHIHFVGRWWSLLRLLLHIYMASLFEASDAIQKFNTNNAIKFGDSWDKSSVNMYRKWYKW